MDDTGVTRRMEIFAGWGMRLDPAWPPATHADGWRKVFEAEDTAGRVFAAGGAGMGWRQLADAAGGLVSVLEQYRMQWRCAEEVAVGRAAAGDAHLAAMAVPSALQPPRRTHPDGPPHAPRRPGVLGRARRLRGRAGRDRHTGLAPPGRHRPAAAGLRLRGPCSGRCGPRWRPASTPPLTTPTPRPCWPRLRTPRIGARAGSGATWSCWRTGMYELGRHPGWSAASASVAAYRSTGEDGVRWAEPVARPRLRRR